VRGDVGERIRPRKVGLFGNPGIQIGGVLRLLFVGVSWLGAWRPTSSERKTDIQHKQMGQECPDRQHWMIMSYRSKIFCKNKKTGNSDGRKNVVGGSATLAVAVGSLLGSPVRRPCSLSS
jgi:hypothetical protein